MPVFHTKTIESILDPVAQQVSRLVILHEEAEDGAPMAELSRPVSVVRQAVSNLVIVGRETITQTTDAILRQDVPNALVRVEKSCAFLEEASQLLRQDPYSSMARKRLIEGSGGILQGTSSLLLYLDESEVRRMVALCQRVLDFVAIAEVIDTMEDLVQFLKDISPGLAQMTRDISSRTKELTHQVHAQALERHLQQVKTLTPILICSIKNYVHILEEGGKRLEKAAENRNYLASRVSDEIHEIIRILQLTTYDEDQSDLDNITVLKKLLNSMQNKMNPAVDWLLDPKSMRGGIGEKSLRQIIDLGGKIAQRILPQDGQRLDKTCSELETKTNALGEMRDNGAVGSTQASESLSRNVRDQLNGLLHECAVAIDNMDKSGMKQIAHTIDGRMEQARKWLTDPSVNDNGVGQRAIALITDEARRIADSLPAPLKNDILQLCDEVDALSAQLAQLTANGQGGSAQAQEIARKLSQRLHELKTRTQDGIVNRVVEDFIDIVTPLKMFTDVVMRTGDAAAVNWETEFDEKAAVLQAMSDRSVRTAKMVAAGASAATHSKQLTEKLQSSAQRLDSLTPQLINAGSIRMTYPDSKAATENFENLRKQYADTIQEVRDLCDEATNTADFVRVSEEKIKKHTHLCEDAIRAPASSAAPQKLVDNASCIARLANRVLLVAKQECDNSEDPAFIRCLNQAIDALQQNIPVMIQNVKSLATNMTDPNAASKWREANKTVLNNVGQIRKVIEGDSDGARAASKNASGGGNVAGMGPLDDQMRNLALGQHGDGLMSSPPPPPRPPLPVGYGSGSGSNLRPGSAPGGQQFETDDENDEVFNKSQSQMNQPIMSAAHGLHRVLRQWSSKDNEMIAAAKKVALLMARLSELVHSSDATKGSKRELIATAKAIADASEDVSRIAKRIAFQCTDKRIRTNLLQVSERIPTIATQLKILSTVKATMLGEQDSEEDREATLMLEGNAQNLMNSVKETVKASEAASIKIQMDTEGKLKWVRRVPWFNYYWT